MSSWPTYVSPWASFFHDCVNAPRVFATVSLDVASTSTNATSPASLVGLKRSVARDSTSIQAGAVVFEVIYKQVPARTPRSFRGHAAALRNEFGNPCAGPRRKPI